MKIRRLIAAVLLSGLLLGSSAYAAEEIPDGGEHTDYMTEMRIAAEDGSPEALRRGALCELDRNLKIREMDLSYEETDFFKPNRSGEEILADILNYIQSQTRVYLGRYYITGYTISYRDCGKIDGVTASGVIAEVGRTVASGKEFAFGTRLYIEGIGERVVEDRGKAVHNGKIDVLFATTAECYAATGWYDVWLIGG